MDILINLPSLTHYTFLVTFVRVTAKPEGNIYWALTGDQIRVRLEASSSSETIKSYVMN